MNMGGHGSGADMAPQRSKGLLKEKLELERVKTRDGRSRVTIKTIDDKLSFDKGFFVFIRALQLLRGHNQGVVLVGLGGASGSGKTAFSAKVKDFMPGIAVISMDNYNDGSKVVDSNFDDPRLTDYDLLLANLSDLQQGKPADIPIYDFKSSKRVGFNRLEVPESRVVVIEGIYALSERLKPLLDLRVSITGGVHFDLVKRVLRDINRSGQGPEEIIQQITDTVFPMYKAFIEPDLKAAQLKIHNSFNPFTGFMDATFILKAPRAKGMTQQAVVAVLGDGALIKTEAEMCDIHLLPPNEDPETCVSWLRMRNREGRYTLMFEEWVTEGDFIISPRIQFEVSVRVLGGLMALGYEIGTVMRRTSTILTSAGGDVTVKFDDVEHLGNFIQVQGKDRDKVLAVAKALKLSDYIPRSYIEQVQLSKLTTDFQQLTDDMRKRFSVDLDGRSVLDEGMYGASPSFSSLTGGAGGAARGSLAGRYGSMGRGGVGVGGGGGSNSNHAVSGAAHPPADGYGSPAGGPVESLLSTSAPVRGSSPIAINHHQQRNSALLGGAAVAVGSSGAAGGVGGVGGVSSSSLGIPRGPPSTAHSPTSSVAAAAGSTVAPSSIISSDGAGSIPGSLESGSGAAALAALAAATAGGSSTTANGSSGGGHSQQRGMAAPSSSAGGGGGGVGGGGSSSTGGGSGVGFAVAGKGNGLLGQQLRNSSRPGSNSSLHTMEGAAAAAEQQQQQQQQLARLSATGFDAPVGGSGGGADVASLALLRRLQDQMEVVAEGFKRHSGMQLHLDALTHQYRNLNESMAALSAATKSLSEVVQHLQQQQGPGGHGASGQQQQQQESVKALAAGTGGSSSSLQQWLQGKLCGEDAAGSAVLLGAGVLVGGVAAAGAMLLLAGPRR